jgi:hypothetical protein
MKANVSRLDSLRSLLQERGQLAPLRDFGRLSSGFPKLDHTLGGGFPRGGLSELSGRPGAGTSSLALAAAARVSQSGELVAYLDPAGTLDPTSMEQTGAVLKRFLWIRSPAPRQLLQVADLLAESGTFPLVVMDLVCLERFPPPAPGVWARLAQRLRSTPVTMLVLTPIPLVGPLARTTVKLSSRGLEPLPGTDLYQRHHTLVQVLRNRNGPVGSAVELTLPFAHSLPPSRRGSTRSKST